MIKKAFRVILVLVMIFGIAFSISNFFFNLPPLKTSSTSTITSFVPASSVMPATLKKNKLF